MVSPYATAEALSRPAPTYVNSKATDDVSRIRAYLTYDDIYNNVPDAFGAILRNDVDTKSRRYVPFGRAVVEGCLRYLGRGLTIVYSAPTDGATTDPAAMAELKSWLEALFKRERFGPKFNDLKRDMLRRGDAVLQISADTSKPEGSRLRITVVDAAQYFPIPMITDVERTAGCYIITLHTSPDGQTIVAQREWYQKILTADDQKVVPGSTIGGIYYKVDFFEKDKWDDRFPLTADDVAPVPPPAWIPWGPEWQLAFQGYMLPASITSLPIYHFPNKPGSGQFGLSLLQGMESMLGGVTQMTTDEDMSVALAGIGVYWTDSGTPKNDKGEDVDWVIGPAAVMELQMGRKFGRVEGVTTIQPMQDHINTLKDFTLETAGVPDIAVGKVDVQVAESGVALAIRMAPVISGNQEREEVLKAGIDQFLWDLLTGWAPAYEARQTIEGFFNVEAHFGDALPVDRDAVIKEVAALIAAGVIDAEYGRQYLSDKLGFTFPDDLGSRMAAAKQAELDAAGARLDAAAAGLGGPPPAATPPANPATPGGATVGQ